jgi:hypothetical protein
MTQAEKQSWEQERAKGEGHFVLHESLIRRGLPFAILMTLGTILVHAFSHHPIYPIDQILAKFALYAVGFGGVMGLMNWRRLERDYQEPTDDDGAGISPPHTPSVDKPG